MKTIFFSGFAGGSGKTTLSVNFARYLHYYEHKRVCLIGFDFPPIYHMLNELSPFPYLCRDMPLIEAENYITGLPVAPDFLIVDCPGVYSLPYINMLHLADYYIVPFEYSLVHFYKSFAFCETIRKIKGRVDQVFMLPNNYCSRTRIDNSKIFSHPAFESTQLLPSINSSKCLKHLTNAPFDKSTFNILRPCFNGIMTRI